MSGTPNFQFPDPLALLEFFGTEPTENGDGRWSYELSDQSGNVLRFSFDAFERSIQTALITASGIHCVTSHEMAVRIEIDGDVLRAHFDQRGATTRMSLRAFPSIEVSWSTLREE